MTGYSKKEILGKDPRFLQGEKTDQSVIDRIRKALKDGSVFKGETYNYRKDGKPFLMSWHIEPIKNASDEIIAFLAIQRDVTEVRAFRKI